MMTKMKAAQMLGLLIILGLQGATHGEAQTFNDQKDLQLPKSYTIDWMKKLNNNLQISELILPGTHDTVALHGGPAAECQAWTLEDQLKAGIRYLDLRAFAFKDTLYLMHGIVYQHLKFTEALDTIKKFLSAYPSETVLVRVKPVLFHKSGVEELVKKAIGNGDNVWVQSSIPTLGDVRGKVVFVQKGRFKLGITLTETDNQGDYKVVNIKNKEQLIVGKFNLTPKKCEKSSVVLRYTSGTGFGTFTGTVQWLTPKTVATEINPWLYNHLQTFNKRDPGVCLGIIAMDFPGLDLIQTIISFNNV